MSKSLRDLKASQGASFEGDVAQSFGNDEAARQAAAAGVALCDRSHWGRIQVSDGDRIRFLHNQSTNDFMILQPGQGCETVFVTSTARTLDLVSAYATEAAVLLQCHPRCRQSLLAWMDRFIFFSDKVQLADVTDKTAAFSLIGPESNGLLRSLGLEAIVGQPEHAHQAVALEGLTLRAAVGSGLASPGYTLTIEAEQAAELWQKLTAAGAIPMGDRLWEELRVVQGRPAPGQELTEDYNPLEAGLWQAVSFNKGCYIGQETIARLNTYGGAKQQLWGLKLAGPVPVGERITHGGERAGVVTSVVETPEGTVGLGYVRSKLGGEGLKVQIGGVSGTVVAVPFLTRESGMPLER
ncbi:MAG: YgfZ/GcvT domain-containing protein [Elainellaceae cyanobacterium]